MDEGVMTDSDEGKKGSIWADAKDVQEAFGIHIETARAWIARGTFGEPFRPTKRTIWVLREEVERVQRKGGAK